MLPDPGKRQSASRLLASCRSVCERRRNAVELLRFDPLDDRAVRIDDHGKRKAEEDGAGIHEFPEEVAIGVEENLGAVEVGRHQLRFAGQRPALQFPVGPRDGDRVVHELLERAREPGIEAALEGDRRDRRHEDGRQDRHQAEQPDDSHVETGRCRPCPALAHQLPGLPGDDPEKQGDQQRRSSGTPTPQRYGWAARALRRRGSGRSQGRRRAPTARLRTRASRGRSGTAPPSAAVQWCPGRSRLKPREIGCLRIGTLSWGDAPTQHCGQIITAAQRQARLDRTTMSSRSRTFLRRVLRLTPRSSAARIWLPRVAARAAPIRGPSISRRTR